MILTRLGNKRGLMKEIYPYFPNHKMRVDLFFGAGGAFFNTPKSEHTILNDLDDDVTNLFLVVKNRKDELYESIKLLPISSSLLNHWKKNKEEDPLLKAIRFLLLSNFSLYGKGGNLRLGLCNTKKLLLSRINPTFEALENTKITNDDFRSVLKKINFSDALSREETFVYLDPIYLGTTHNYKVPSWTKESTRDCLDIMSNSGCKCALSEFDHPFIINEAKRRGFNLIPIKERRNIKNNRLEMLYTNYDLDIQKIVTQKNTNQISLF